MARFNIATPVASAATDVSTTFFTANCNSVSGATSYRLDVAPVDDFGSFVSGYQSANLSPGVTVLGLTADTSYWYRWRAVKGTYTTPNSNTISQKTAATLVAPSTPTGLSVWESGIESWSASWNSVIGATGYHIRTRTNSGSWSFAEFVAGTSYSSIFRYDPCDYVEVQVRATNSAGDSAWSSAVGVSIDCV